MTYKHLQIKHLHLQIKISASNLKIFASCTCTDVCLCTHRHTGAAESKTGENINSSANKSSEQSVEHRPSSA